MAIKSVTESWERREVKETFSEKSTTRVFTVEFDSSDDPVARPLLALKSPQVPQIGNEHPYDRSSYVIERSVRPGNGAFVYEVTCNYMYVKYGSRERTENPLKQPPKISWTFATANEPIDRDINDKPILNSALESFDPPITEDFDDLVLRYETNERAFSPLTALHYKGKVNSDSFLGSPPGTVRCTVYDGVKVYDDEFGDYYQVTREFQFRYEEVAGVKKGWLRRILDQGFRELDGTKEDGSPKWANITDTGEKDGNPISQPALLDGKGKKQPYNGTWPPTAVFLEFKTRKEVSFSALKIKV